MFSHVSNQKKQLCITVLLVGLLVLGGNLPPLFENLVFYLVIFGVALLAYIKKKHFNILLAISLIFYICAWFFSFKDIMLNILFIISEVLCLIYSVIATIKFILKSKNASSSEVLAAVNCYIMIGYLWAFVYILVEGFSPGSFSMQTKHIRSMDTFIYYSFVTMATVGYGDMFPVSLLSQRLSIVQAILGQFYFSLIVAYLINRLFQENMKSIKNMKP